MFIRKPNRLSQYDYSQYGWYFVTACTEGMKEWFGEVKDGAMTLNEYGLMARRCWEEILRRYDGVELDEFVVMPNHVHGIVIVNQNNFVGDAYMRPAPVAQARPIVGVAYMRPLQRSDRSKMLLSRVVQGFKSGVSRELHRSGLPEFQWQRSFYDHIIRSDESLEKIRQYIRNNPLNWELEKGKSENYMPDDLV